MKKIDLKNIFSSSNKKCINLLENMLVFNPAKRILINEALEHEYFKDIRNNE